MTKNYEFLKVEGSNLYRIKALRDIRIETPTATVIINEGTLGGCVEMKESLPQDSNSWIYENGVVRGKPTIKDTVLVAGEIKGKATVIGSYIEGKGVSIQDNAIVRNSTIYGNAIIYQQAVVRNCTLGTDDINNSNIIKIGEDTKNLTIMY